MNDDENVKLIKFLCVVEFVKRNENFELYDETSSLF